MPDCCYCRKVGRCQGQSVGKIEYEYYISDENSHGEIEIPMALLEDFKAFLRKVDLYERGLS